MNLRLSQQLVLLVMVPLIFDLILLGALSIALQQVESSFQAESRARMAINSINQVMKNLLLAATSIGTHYLRKDDSYRTKLQALGTQLVGLRAEFKSQLEKEVADSEQFKKFDEYLGESAAVASNSEALITSKNNLEGLMALGRINKMLQLVNNSGDGVLILQQNLSEKRERELARAKKTVWLIILIGLAVNVTVGMLLAIYFTKRTSARLKTLMDNNERLANNNPLSPKLMGHDELAQLDDTFHRMVQQLEMARAEKKRLEQLRKEFVAMISHDLRSPMTSLLVTLNLLSSNAMGELQPKGKDLVKSAEASLTKLVEMVSDLLDLDRLENGKMDLRISQYLLADIVYSSIDKIDSLADAEGIKIEVSHCDVRANCDADRISRVLVNLLANAIKFSPKDSSITVRVKESTSSAIVEVCDQGPGIPPELQDAIFDKYKQVSIDDAVKKSGTGLGLSICKALVDAHDGKIGVRNNPSGGSCFWFELPKTTS